MELASEIFIVLAYIAAIGFFIFGLDDILFDLQFVFHLLRNKETRHITIQQLRGEPEKYIALFVPAWMEGGVVNRMADYAVKILEYERYDIFVGVYPNDPETIACVDAISASCPHIHKVMCPNPGPTSKADCLNAIYHAMRLREIPGVREYEILALHDSEDVLHPLTLKVYNYFVPRTVDMGQIPVFPLELPPLKNWVSNTYMDDFSELHLKDMLARQEIGGVVPSAGVGTAFSRRAIDYLADHNDSDPFLVGNLTEDYYIGIQLKRAGFSAGFINYPIDRVVKKTDAEGRVISKRFVTEIVAVRENFPRRFWEAVRQRSRWILGISMQCWEIAGWAGSAAVRYTLYRDRRAPLVHFINAVGYIVIFSWLLESLVRLTPLAATAYWRPLFTPDSFLWGLILVDTTFLIYRVSLKVYYVTQIYGWKQGLFSIPRYPIGNFINFFATCRALWMYFQNRVLGKPLVWLKTTHVFPTTTELAGFAASIEDLLVQDGLVTRERLEELMHESRNHSAPTTLLNMRLIDEERFTALWVRFSNIRERCVVPEEMDLEPLRRMDEERSIAWGAIPIRMLEDGSMETAFLEPPSPEVRQWFETNLGVRLSERLIRPTDLKMIRDFGYSNLAVSRRRKSLTAACRTMEPEKWREARLIQYTTGRMFSDIVVDLGFMSAADCRRHWADALGAQPCSLQGQQADEAALQALGPIYCDLHRIAPLSGGRLLVRDAIHPEVLDRVSQLMGGAPTLVADLAEPTGRFLAELRKRHDPETTLLDLLISRGALSPESAAEAREMRVLLDEPIESLLIQTASASAADVRAAFGEISGLPVLDEALDRGDAPPGVLPPGFEASHGCRVIEAGDGLVTIGLDRMLAARQISAIFARLNLCAVRFVLLPVKS